MARILVVDDERAIRRILSKVLTRNGHTVVEAGTAEEGLDLLYGVDVVLLDLAMPGIGGMGFLSAVKGKGVPVIVVSAYYAESKIDEALSAGARSFIVKPFEFAEVLSSVSDALEGK